MEVEQESELPQMIDFAAIGFTVEAEDGSKQQYTSGNCIERYRSAF